MAVTSEVIEIAPDEILKELEKVLASPAFSRSERSQHFLRYVCDLTLRGESARINQYLIGCEVFQRGPNYSTEEDSSVRRQAHVLRQKLDAYYAHEGRNDLVRIELPVGQYVPAFHRQEPAATAQAVPDVVTQAAAPAPGAPALPRSVEAAGPSPAWLALGGVLLLLAGWVAGQRSATPLPRVKPQGPVAEIWGPWLADPSGATICFSNPMTAMVRSFPQPVAGEHEVTRVRATPAEEKLFREAFDIPAGRAVYLTASKVNTKVGESISAVQLAAFFTLAGAPIHATQSRLLTWEALRTENFIILGQNDASPWIDPLLRKYPFRLADNQERGFRYIVNTSPTAGEPAEYRVEYPPGAEDPTQEYALVSMIPGLDEGKKLLLISGLNTQATQMATEFLTDRVHLQRLVARLQQAAPGHKGPWHFQAVLRTEVRDKVPTAGAELITFRVL